MIAMTDITAKDIELTADIRKYLEKKIGRLDRYMPKHAKKSAEATIRLRADRSKKTEKFMAEVVLKLPNGELTAKESTLNIYAAIDIVEAKLRNQLRKYKEKHSEHSSDRKGVMRKVRQLADKDFWGSQN